MLIIRLIIAFLIFIAGTLLANHLVIAILRETFSGKLEYSNKGYAIGVLERFLLITLIVIGEFSLIGWIVAIKALAAYQHREEKQSSEYILIGTLSSFSFALLSGLLIRSVLQV